ncbi:MAG: hypothetical protein U0166_26140 [Acidobacteriota bacterium]
MKTRALSFVCLLLFAASMASAQSISIDTVKVEPKTSSLGSDKGKQYLRIAFRAKVGEAVAPKMTIVVKGRAWVGDQVLVDDIRALGAKLEDIQAGDAKDITVPLFMSNGLGGRADKCELTFTLVKGFEKSGQRLATFCWDGSGSTAGNCQ